MAKKAVLYFFLFTLFLIIFKIVLHQDNLSKINKVNNIPKCNDLDYSKGLFLHPHNFQKINLNIIINDNRRWKTLLLEEEIQAKARQIKFNSNYKFYETRKIRDYDYSKLTNKLSIRKYLNENLDFDKISPYKGIFKPTYLNFRLSNMQIKLADKINIRLKYLNKTQKSDFYLWSKYILRS